MKISPPIKYPCIPRDEKKTVKLTLHDIEIVRRLRQNGMLVKDIANKFDVTTSTINYWVLDNFRNKAMARSRKRHSDLYNTDEEFRQNKNKSIIEWKIKRKIESKQYAKYTKEYNMLYLRSKRKQQRKNKK